MIRSRLKDRMYILLGMLGDTAVFWMTFHWAWEVYKGRDPLSPLMFTHLFFSPVQVLSLALVAGLCFGIFASLKLYNYSAYISKAGWIARILLAAQVAVIISVLATVFIGGEEINTDFSFYAWPSMTFGFLTYRLILLQVVHYRRRRGRSLRYVVIVGLGKRSIELWRKLDRVEYGYVFKGFVDDLGQERAVSHHLQLPFLCSIEEFTTYISQNAVDEVWVALPLKSHYNAILDIIKEGTKQGLKIRMLTDLFDLPNHVGMSIGKVADISFINYDADVRSEVLYDFKRVIDIVCSLTGIVLLLPVYLFVGLLVFLTDGRPIFFKQERVGLNKRRFCLFKFRTMVRNAQDMQDELEDMNEKDGAVFKIASDPRVTRLGRFLRKTSLDELPQLFNILKGDMSLVGPRPMSIRDFERFYSDSHRLRFSVKPGLTGLWQVSGRSDVDFEEWMKLDIFYVRNWSLFMDMRIVMQTVWIVLTMKGAY